MKTHSLRIKLLATSFITIVVFAGCVSLLGLRIIKNDIIARAQRQVEDNLRVAHAMYSQEIEAIRQAFSLIPLTSVDFSEVKKTLGLDYLYVVRQGDRARVKSEIVQKAFTTAQPVGGIRIIGDDELAGMGSDITAKAYIEIRPTPQSHPTQRTMLHEAMAIGYAMPVLDNQGAVQSVVYGGKVINRDFALVDKIRNLVFANQLYAGRPVGTVTIFLDDIRIATNVLDKSGNRAIGTVVSDTVYKKVVQGGRVWLDRAFVVTDWYLTAYEPIRNIAGDVIGILYVGTLEQPFKDLEKRILFGFMTIIVLISILASVLSYILASAVSTPVIEMLEATARISGGDLAYRIKTRTDIAELKGLGEAFNDMAGKLKERQESYFDLIGFVAHELKGILASTILNAYSVRDGFLGMVNFKQRKALDSITRNLDYLDSTVKNFLNLSRIEKGEMALNLAHVLLREEIFDVAVDAFSKSASEKEIRITNDIETAVSVRVDPTLMQIAANNLIGNAVKYGAPAGHIGLTSKVVGGSVEVEVYNDGVPLKDEERARLFKKFSRLESSSGRKAQGTGLGLFITRQIIEKHGGTIRVEARSGGNAFIIHFERGM